MLVLALVVQVVVAQGLKGAPPPGLKGAPGIGLVNPKTLAFEQEVLAALNEARQKAGATPVTLDEKLRLYARREAELAATGSPEAQGAEQRLKTQGLAPYGHRLQYGYGTNGKNALAELFKDAAVKKALLAEFARGAVGAFHVPEDKPYYQLLVVLVAEPDPMAGRPGLSPQQTDPVVNAATPRIRACYDAVLKRDPNAKGDVIFQMVIGGKGTVDSQKLLKSFGDADFDACALGVTAGLVFPLPYKGKPVTLNHPMRFTPPQGDKKVGKLTDQQIQTAFGWAAADFKSCYDARAKEKPKLQGTITLGLTVSEEGAVGLIDIVHDELEDKVLVGCVLTRARQLRFPAPEFHAPVSFTYPLRFAPPQ